MRLFVVRLAALSAIVICCQIQVPAQSTGDLPPRDYSQLPAQLTNFGSVATGAFLPGNLGGPNALATPHMIDLLTRIIHDQWPPLYEDERHWDKRREIWDGVHVRLHDGKLETHRKTKLARSGTWTRYSFRLVDPEKNLQVQFDRLEPVEDGKIAFAATVEAVLDVHGQLTEWLRDSKLYSISADAHVAVRLNLEGTVQVQVVPRKLLPDISLKPHVDHAHLELIRYRLRRVSHVGGDAAKLLGKSLKMFVDERVEVENERLAARINRRLARRSHKMTFSAQDLLKPKRTSPKSKPKKVD